MKQKFKPCFRRGEEGKIMISTRELLGTHYANSDKKAHFDVKEQRMSHFGGTPQPGFFKWHI